MCHSTLASASLFALLLHIDEELSEAARVLGCLFAGGRLHHGDFERKPRDWLAPLGRRAPCARIVAA